MQGTTSVCCAHRLNVASVRDRVCRQHRTSAKHTGTSICVSEVVQVDCIAFMIAYSSLLCNKAYFVITSGYATWFTAGDAIRIGHYDVIDDVITQNKR